MSGRSLRHQAEGPERFWIQRCLQIFDDGRLCAVLPENFKGLATLGTARVVVNDAVGGHGKSLHQLLGVGDQQFTPPGGEAAGFPVLPHAPLLAEAHGAISDGVGAVFTVELIHNSIEPTGGAAGLSRKRRLPRLRRRLTVKSPSSMAMTIWPFPGDTERSTISIAVLNPRVLHGVTLDPYKERCRRIPCAVGAATIVASTIVPCFM